MTKCIICEKRPARERGYCANCESQMISRRKPTRQVFRFVTYRGSVVAFYRNGNGMLTPELTRHNPSNLPKSKTLNLNNYLDGFTRKTIKDLKRCVLALANA